MDNESSPRSVKEMAAYDKLDPKIQAVVQDTGFSATQALRFYLAESILNPPDEAADKTIVKIRKMCV